MVYADLHIHSPFAHACSKEISFEGLTKWAKQKGIKLLGTGDCFHPKWKERINDLSNDLNSDLLYFGMDQSVYYIPTVEVNCIDGRYEVHMLMVFPNMRVAGQIEKKLSKWGSFNSNGRPNIKLSPGQLMNEVKGEFLESAVIAAHILTPWFGMYGARNNIESYTDLFDKDWPPDAIESGLSADWRMAGAIKEMNNIPVVSFSDAHSMPNIGREVTKFTCDLNTDEILSDLKRKQMATLEYPPALGRYHFSGHRECNYSVPAGGELMCPKCFKVVTKGVEERLRELETQWPVHEETYIFPLNQLLSLVYKEGPRDSKVVKAYWKLTSIASEIDILLRVRFDSIKTKEFQKNELKAIEDIVMLARYKQLKIIPGYDGKYGEIVDISPIMYNNMEKASDLFTENKEHKAFWDRAELVSELMNNGDIAMTRDQYETLCRGPL